MTFDQSFSKSISNFYWKFFKGSKLTEVINRLVLERTRIISITLYNVCSVHWGVLSTLGDVQYIRGEEILSTSGGIS